MNESVILVNKLCEDIMGFYKDGEYVYEPMDVGNGVCDKDIYDKQERQKQKKLDDNNAGEIGSLIESEKD